MTSGIRLRKESISMNKSKYGNKKYEVDGIKFDSKREANRYRELKVFEKAKLIKDLKLQVPFELIPKQPLLKPFLLKNGKTKRHFSSISYVADFTYIDCDTGDYVVEDAKGFETDVFKLKEKMMLYFHNIQIRKV